MVKVIIPPEKEPVEVDDLRQWMQCAPITPEQEPLATAMLKAGREEAEAYQNAAYCEQTLQIAPDNLSGAIVLPRPPFRALVSVICYSPDGGQTDITALVLVDDVAFPAELHLKEGAAIPCPLRKENPILITYTAGYDEVPERVRHAILIYATWAWLHRSGGEPLPVAFYDLLRKRRVVPV